MNGSIGHRMLSNKSSGFRINPLFISALRAFLSRSVTCTGLLVSGLLLPAVVCAQNNKALINITSLQPAKVQISLEVDSPRVEWSFRNTYGSVVGLSERIENVSALNGMKPVTVERLAPGVYRAQERVSRITYEVSLAELKRLAHMSHVSWLTPDRGLLMLADLLPELSLGKSEPVQVKLKLPKSWSAVAGVKETGGNYVVPVVDRGVFLLGSSLRVLTGRITGQNFRLAITGNWPLKDDELRKTAVRVVEEYVRLVRQPFAEDSVLMLSELEGGPGVWTAETRGNSIVLLLSTNEPGRRLRGRLGIILAHEALHLWVPNALDLQGDYDWFFEGFTLYQALLSSQRLKLIDFDEYLRTLARVYDSYQRAPQRDDWSLLDLSERRWTTPSSLLYDKGMLIAMIYDLRVREMTKGKSSLSSLYPDLFRSAVAKRADANEVIIALLERPALMSDFAATYIRNSQPIDLPKILSNYGISVDRSTSTVRFVVKKPLTQQQKIILRSLGYRN